MEHRHDINGLRAISVIAVLFFHFNLLGLQGGFAGVDVFYVISGFLMTGIIIRGVDKKTFSFKDFFAARARRIVPALSAMGLVTLLVGFFLVDAQSYRELALDVLSANFFVSNVKFFREHGYFDSNSNFKWMLHTWSTSVEWQFYILYPICLILIRRLFQSPKAVAITLWVGLAISLAAGVRFTSTHQAAAFYLLPFRAWEMIIGGLVALRAPGGDAEAAEPKRINSLFLHYLGLAMICLSIIGFGPATPWPSYWAIAPVLGATLVLLAGQKDAFWARLPIVSTLGAWSYSIYIWHWPVLVLSHYLDLPETLGVQVLLLAIIFLLAYGSYTFIETPFQGRRDGATMRFGVHPRMLALGALWSSAVLFALFVTLAGGLPQRGSASPELVKDYAIAAADRTFPDTCSWNRTARKLTPCVIGSPNQGTAFIGDSHAEMLYARFAANPKGQSYTFLTLGGCPPLLGVRKAHEAGSECDQFAKQAFQIATTQPYKRVVLTAFWPVYLDAPPPGKPGNPNQLCFVGRLGCKVEDDPAAYRRALDRSFEQLAQSLSVVKARGGEVVVMLPTPYATFDIPREIRKDLFWGKGADHLSNLPRAEVEAATAESRARLLKLAARLGARVIDPLPVLCTATVCPLTAPDGRSYYIDSNHIRASMIRTDRFNYLDAIAAPPSSPKSH
ncbi:acyltransferase family protein [Caulobacter segnis]|uniref:Acyltransferase n=1 Tax=Caulobacter segnis TaxID=88688 RepID=A0A2W5UYV9_9CAUL|nr:acyltransferase family protein [Caulobacter segnis]PZR32162.1 MAG: hypothetical protein DI526_17430 [Caulobacter segnis]